MKEEKFEKQIQREKKYFVKQIAKKRFTPFDEKEEIENKKKFHFVEHFENLSYYEDLAIIYPAAKAHKIFFREKGRRATKSLIVKIENTESKKQIYRLAIGGNVTKDTIALNYLSIKELGIDIDKDIEIDMLRITKPCFPKCKFYLNNPRYAVRIAWKLGMISIGLALIAIAIALLSVFK